jgi:hypothetical protein
MRIIGFLSLLGGAVASLRSAETWRYTTANQTIFLDREKITVRGITWRGLDTEIMAPLGLWRHSIEFYLDTLRAHNINTVRIPLDEDWVLYKSGVPAFPCQVIQELSANKTSLDILDGLMEKTRRKQIYVVLSMDRAGDTAWGIILDRYKTCKNLLGLEVSRKEIMESLKKKYGPCPWLFFTPEPITGAVFVPKITSTRVLINALYEEWDSEFGNLTRNTTVVPRIASASDVFFRYLSYYLREHAIGNVFMLNMDSDPTAGIFDGDDWTNLRLDLTRPV